MRFYGIDGYKKILADIFIAFAHYELYNNLALPLGYAEIISKNRKKILGKGFVNIPEFNESVN